MKPWSDTIQLPESVRDLLFPGTPAPTCRENGSAEQEQRGYERGRQDAEAEWKAKLLEQEAAFQQLQNGVLASLQQFVPNTIREVEQELVALACEVAQKLVAGLPLSAEMVEAAIREALGQAEKSHEMHVHLHPQDLLLLKQADSSLLRPDGSPVGLQFHESGSVARGGCLVRTRFGTIDGTRETKMELLRKSLVS